jgi:hypothetical protein
MYTTSRSVLAWINLWKFASSEVLLQRDSQSLSQDEFRLNTSPTTADATNFFLAPLSLIQQIMFVLFFFFLASANADQITDYFRAS